MVCSSGWSLAQETSIPTTRTIDTRLQQQVQHNEAELRGILNTTPDSLAPTATDTAPRLRARGLDDNSRPGVLSLNMPLTVDETYKLQASNGTIGFVLTGKWISDYARKSRLIPAYEKTLAGYREQAALNQQLLGELEMALGIKDKRIAVLEEINGALEERGDLYKAKAEILDEPFFKKLFRNLSYPLGFTAGVFVGIVLSNNVN